MVTDLVSNAHVYVGLGERIARALNWIQARNLADLEPGRHEIEGQNLFALVSEYVTKPAAESRWEAHRKYLDLQCLASGREHIGYAPLATLQGSEYIAEKDITWLEGSGSFIVMEPGRFMLLWAGDGHNPGITTADPESVKKVVLKIAVE